MRQLFWNIAEKPDPKVEIERGGKGGNTCRILLDMRAETRKGV